MELQLRFAQFSIRLGPWAAWPAWVLFQLLVAPSAAWLPLLLIDATIERPIVWVWLVWLLFYVVVLVRQARFWRLWLPWTRPTGHRSLELFFGAYQSLVIITAAFAGATAIFYSYGWITASEPIVTERIVWEALVYYVWSLLDGIPVLEVPQTLNWEPAITFTDHMSGALLLAYKLFVIVPIVSLVVGLLKEQPEDTDRRSA
jgi:hypothetical protein